MQIPVGFTCTYNNIKTTTTYGKKPLKSKETQNKKYKKKRQIKSNLGYHTYKSTSQQISQELTTTDGYELFLQRNT